MFKYFIFILTLFFINILNAADSALTLKQQFERLQREVIDLQKTIYTGSRDNSSQPKQQLDESADLTAFDLRIYDLEKDLKQLNENFEELTFQIDDIKKLYEQLSLNIDTLLLNNQNNLINNNDISIEDDKNDISIEDDISKENIIIKETDKEDTIINENNLGSFVISSEDRSNQKKEELIENQNFEQKITKLSAEDEYQRAFEILSSQQFSEAKDALKEFINNHKEHKLSGAAHYWLGEIYLLKKEYSEAALIFAEGYQKFPKSIKAPDMLYKLSESLINIDRKNNGCNTLKILIKEFPQHKLLIKAENKIISLDCNVLTE